jgi:peptidoglycan/LPS O-acetylase OafA/YrhL
MNKFKRFLKNHLSEIRTIKIIVAVLLALMVIIDIVLGALETKDLPTFSFVVKTLRHRLIWFTFLYGGLVSKIFYNRKVGEKEKEVTGLLAFFSMVVLLFVIGRNLETAPGLFLQVLLLVTGGIMAYRAWPQYR